MRFNTKSDARKAGLWLYFTADSGELISTTDKADYDACPDDLRCAFRVRAKSGGFDAAMDRQRAIHKKAIRKNNLGMEDSKEMLYTAIAEALVVDTMNVFDDDGEIGPSETQRLVGLFLQFEELPAEINDFASKGLNFNEAAEDQAGKSRSGSASPSLSETTPEP